MKPQIFKFFLLMLFVCSAFYGFSQKSTEILIQANRATLERDYSKAIDLYNKYIQLNPSDFRGYFNRGTTEHNAGKYLDAVRDFSKTLSLNPIYKEAYYYRGQGYVQLKKYTLAINDYNHILNKEPSSVPFLKLRSEAYIASNQSSLALKDLNAAISVSKLSGDLYKRRAELKVELKDIDGALKDYNAVQKLIPRYKMVHYIKGNLFLEINEKEFACDEFKLAIDNGVVVADRAYEANCK